MNGRMKDKKPASETRPKGVISDLSRSVELLAAHLCAYADVLRQCAVKPGGR